MNAYNARNREHLLKLTLMRSPTPAIFGLLVPRKASTPSWNIHNIYENNLLPIPPIYYGANDYQENSPKIYKFPFTKFILISIDQENHSSDLSITCSQVYLL